MSVANINNSVVGVGDGLKIERPNYNPNNPATLNKIDNTVEEWIEDYQEENSNMDLKQQTMEEAFISLKNYIAANAYDAASGNWLNISDKNVQYWTDNPLRFTKNEQTGAYLIEQQDENGNWTAMGYTDETTVYNYLNKIKNLETPKEEQPKETPTVTEQPKEKKEIIKIDKNEIPDSVHKEVMEYLTTARTPSFSRKPSEYYSLSETAKKIVDGEIIFKTTEDYYVEVLENGGEFTIPKGKVLTIPGEIRNLIEGESIKVDITTGKVIDSNGKTHNIEDLKNAEFN